VVRSTVITNLKIWRPSKDQFQPVLTGLSSFEVMALRPGLGFLFLLKNFELTKGFFRWKFDQLWHNQKMPDMWSMMPNIVDLSPQPPPPPLSLPHLYGSLWLSKKVRKSFSISYIQAFRPYEVWTEWPHYVAPPLIQGCGLTFAGCRWSRGFEETMGRP